MHTKIIELKVYHMVLVFSFFKKLTKNSVMFHLMYIFFVSLSLLSLGDFLLKCMLIKEERIKLYNSLSQVQCYNHFYYLFFFSTTEIRGPLSIKAYEGILRPTGLTFKDLRCISGSLYVYGKLPTYPSPKPILTHTSHLRQNVG